MQKHRDNLNLSGVARMQVLREDIWNESVAVFKKPNFNQGWIQTSATSFQKLVRIVKKLKKKKKPESHARKSQPVDANSSQVFNYRIC